MSFDPNNDQEKELVSDLPPENTELQAETQTEMIVPAPKLPDIDEITENAADPELNLLDFDSPIQFPDDAADVPQSEQNKDAPEEISLPVEPIAGDPSAEANPELLPEPPQEPEAEIPLEVVPPENDPDLKKIMDEFAAITPEEAEPERPKKKRKPVKKGRPRRKKGEGLLGIPNIMATAVWCGLTLLVGLTLGRLVWVCAAEVLAFGREDKSVTITIFETDTIDDITKKLARAELIRYPGLFKLYASFAVDEGDIKPGMWDLNTKYDYHALVKMMSPSSSRAVVKVTIPEGYTCRQIFALLEENKVCTVQDLEAYAADGTLDDYWFLNDVARGDKYSLEGFLFPDTYEFYQNDTPRNVLQRMLNNFENKFNEDLQWQLQSLNTHLTDLMRRNGYGQDYIDSHLFSVKDVVNVASMIEKETSSAQEGYTIASVIYNRLFCWGNNPAYLNIDATIVYALDGKTDLTAEDLRVDSPYNTYTNIGLTPGPISNPGLASLKAALAPSDTNYYFYVLDPAAGSHHFSTTQAEHDAFRASLGG